MAREDAKEELEKEEEMEIQKMRDLDIVRLVESRNRRRMREKRKLMQSQGMYSSTCDSSSSDEEKDEEGQKRRKETEAQPGEKDGRLRGNARKGMDDLGRISWLDNRERKRKEKAKQKRWRREFPRLPERLTCGTCTQVHTQTHSPRNRFQVYTGMGVALQGEIVCLNGAYLLQV